MSFLAEDLLAYWCRGCQAFLCGNGGSARNALHIAIDLLYGVTSHVDRPGMRVETLSANTSVLNV